MTADIKTKQNTSDKLKVDIKEGKQTKQKHHTVNNLLHLFNMVLKIVKVIIVNYSKATVQTWET